MTDHVWVRIHEAVQAAFDELGVREQPPQTKQDFDGLAETIADHVAASMPRPVYRTFRQTLKDKSG